MSVGRQIQQRMMEQLKTLARERGGVDRSAQLVGDTRKLSVFLAELKKRADDLNIGIDDANQQLAAIEVQIAALEDQIPDLANDITNITNSLEGGNPGDIYIKGGATLGGDWTNPLAPMGSGGMWDIQEGANGISMIERSGLMVCLSPPISLTPNVAAGDIFTSAAGAWTFDRPFSSAPLVSACQVSDSRTWGVAVAAGLSSASAVIRSHVSIATAVTVRLRAEGRA